MSITPAATGSQSESASAVLARTGHQPFSRRNYFAYSIEGGLYVGGMAFLTVETVLPSMMYSLGAPDWLIALMPVLTTVGFTLPTLLTAHWFEHRARMLPFLLISGVFQRLPYLIGFVLLMFMASDWPLVTLIGVALVPLVSGLVGGIGGPAWLELSAKLLPRQRRASALALRWTVGAVLGIGAGVVIETILAAEPGIRGFAWLHLCAFGCLVLSYLVFCLQREIPDQRRGANERRSLIKNLRTVPELIRGAPAVRRLMIAKFCGLAVWVVVPFMALFAQQTLAVEASFVGRLVMAQMLGSLLGNAVAAWVGDRVNGRVVWVSSYLVFFGVFLGVNLATSDWGFMSVFAVWGFGFALHQVGSLTVALEVMPIDRRPTGMSVIGAVNACGLLVMSTLGGQFQEWSGASEIVLWLPTTVAAMVLTLGTIMAFRVELPQSGRA